MNDEKAVAIYDAMFDAALENNMTICVQEKSQKLPMQDSHILIGLWENPERVMEINKA